MVLEVGMMVVGDIDRQRTFQREDSHNQRNLLSHKTMSTEKTRVIIVRTIDVCVIAISKRVIVESTAVKSYCKGKEGKRSV